MNLTFLGQLLSFIVDLHLKLTQDLHLKLTRLSWSDYDLC